MKCETPASYLVIKAPDATSMKPSTDNRDHRIHWHYVHITITDSTGRRHLLHFQAPAPAEHLCILQHPTNMETSCSYGLETHIPWCQPNDTTHCFITPAEHRPVPCKQATIEHRTG
uniref:CRI4 n=1 Tax=Arundo donax TaxID=35708 RepID=A0A0A9B8A0_ARUDO